MNISEPGLKLIEGFEGYKSKAYLDSGDLPTIGFGTTIYPNGVHVRMGDECNKEQAAQWLKHDVQSVVEKLNNLHFNIPITQNQFDALVSFAYNLGFGSLTNSTLYRYARQNPNDENIWKYDKENPVRTCEFTKWINCKGKMVEGLLNRRIKEADYYSQGLS